MKDDLTLPTKSPVSVVDVDAEAAAVNPNETLILQIIIVYLNSLMFIVTVMEEPMFSL